MGPRDILEFAVEIIVFFASVLSIYQYSLGTQIDYKYIFLLIISIFLTILLRLTKKNGEKPGISDFKVQCAKWVFLLLLAVFAASCYVCLVSERGIQFIEILVALLIAIVIIFCIIYLGLTVESSKDMIKKESEDHGVSADPNLTPRANPILTP